MEGVVEGVESERSNGEISSRTGGDVGKDRKEDRVARVKREGRVTCLSGRRINESRNAKTA
jgi:hypothetical protein